jgi:hypothetical protein
MLLTFSSAALLAAIIRLRNRIKILLNPSPQCAFIFDVHLTMFRTLECFKEFRTILQSSQRSEWARTKPLENAFR